MCPVLASASSYPAFLGSLLHPKLIHTGKYRRIVAFEDVPLLKIAGGDVIRKTPFIALIDRRIRFKA